MISITLPSPAKLNLFLHILDRREDGYHNLQTLFQLLDYGDQLSFSANKQSEINDVIYAEGNVNVSYRGKLLKADTVIYDKLNKKIDNFDGDLYLFGGTGFSIYLIMFGLQTDKIVYILDNDPEKENKKVYGTNFIVKNPKIIKDKSNVAVIVKAASYQQEIEKQLYTLNKNILILT